MTTAPIVSRRTRSWSDEVIHVLLDAMHAKES